jgi:glycosyltransferase involved in cell wall biosynthesis
MVSPRSPLNYYGGVEHHVLEISKRLRERGFELEVLATDSSSHISETTTAQGITVRTFPAIASQNSYDFSLGLYKAIKRTTSDIIHIHGFYASHMPLAALAKKDNQKLILTIHSCASSSMLRRAFRVPYHLFCRRILSNADKLVCVSKEEYLQYRKYLGLPISRYTVIPNGVNIQDFAELPDERRTEDPYVLSVGRLEKCKGFHFLIKSFAQLKKKYPSLKLNIIGTGPYKRNLLQLISKLNLQDTIKIHERIPREKVVSLYKGCTLFALLSSGESSGIVVLEALAAKKPVLVTTSYALKEYVEQGVAVGVPYPPSQNQVCDSISSILENPDAFVPHSVGIKTWDQVVDQLSLLYDEVLYGA